MRSLWRQPGFTAMAVLMLALGIGANTAMFSVVNAVLLRPLPYPEPDRIVRVQTKWKTGATGDFLSGPDYEDVRKQSSSLAHVAYFFSEEVSASANGRAEYAGAALVTPSFFPIFQVPPSIGRTFTAAEAEHGAPAEAVVSAGYWNAHFAGKTLADGETVSLMRHEFQVIGVMPAGFDYPKGTAIWIPSWMYPEETERSAGFAFVLARLKPGVSLSAGRAEIATIAGRLAKEYPDSNKEKGFTLTPLLDHMVAKSRLTLNVLLAAVALVLLIACANVSNLFLARGTARRREIAVRMAIGASRIQIYAQFCMESMYLALVAAVAGVLLGSWGLTGLKAITPADLPRLDQIHLDPIVLAFAAAVSLAAMLLATIAPAWQASLVDPNQALAQSGRHSVVGGMKSPLRSALVIAEVAVSVVLVAGAVLLIRSLSAVAAVNPGFDATHLLLVQASVPSSTQEDARRNDTRYFQPMLDELSRTPGVVTAASVDAAPLNGDSPSWGSYSVQGQSSQLNVDGPQAYFVSASSGYFRTLRIPLVAGRPFSRLDGFDAPSVAVIDSALARKSFGSLNPIGRKILCGMDQRTMKWMTIVGIVGDVHIRDLTDAADVIYVPMRQHPQSDLQFAVRTRANPMALADVVTRMSFQLNPEAAVRFTSMDRVLSGSLAATRFRAVLLSIFAGLALLLAAAGIYAVVAFSVAQRTAEIGLRMAIGAGRAQILQMVFGQTGRLTAAGLAIGAIASALTSRFVQSLLFQVPRFDVVSYLAMLCVLSVAAAAAGFVPAYRATRIEPLRALRED